MTTDITVTTAPGDRPAAAGSVLADLRARRTKLVKALFIDLKVPRWDDDGGPSIWVRYKPSDPGKIDDINGKRDEARKTEGKDWYVNANADILIDSCIGVFAKDGDATYSLKPDDPTGPWTTFDTDLAVSLGLDAKGARDAVKALYLTNGDLIGAALRLNSWSGEASITADEEFSGN